MAEVPFGRHAVDAPDDLIRDVQTIFELGALQGEEHEDQRRTRELLERLEWETQRLLRLPDEPNYSVSLSSFKYKEADVDIRETYYLGPTVEPMITAKIVIETGALPLVFYGPIHGLNALEAAANARALIDAIAPHPTAAHATPFCTPSYSIDIQPKLGQRIEVGMESKDGRALVLESAYVRGREHRDEGAPVLARDSLAIARAGDMSGGTGVVNAHVCRRTLKVAGMVAPEVVWTTNEGRGGLLHFAWVHLGVAHDAWRPYMSIYFSGDLASSTRLELNQQWTAILRSLRPLSTRSRPQ